jgi:hypothetical protein
MCRVFICSDKYDINFVGEKKNYHPQNKHGLERLL